MFKKGSIKTTLTGIAGILGGIVAILKGDIATGVTTIITGAGLVFAKDHNAK
jgi:L-aminopeptidase/D-esterase-like protein